MQQASQEQKELWAVPVAQGLQAPQVIKVPQVTQEHLGPLVGLAHQVFADQTVVLAVKVLLDYREILAAVALQETPVLLDRLDLRDREETWDLLELLEAVDQLDLQACQVTCAVVQCSIPCRNYRTTSNAQGCQ